MFMLNVNIFSVVQNRPGYVEFKIRHDLRGDLLSEQFVEESRVKFGVEVMVPFVTKAMRQNAHQMKEYYCVWCYGTENCQFNNEEIIGYVKETLRAKVSNRLQGYLARNKHSEKSNLFE